MPRFPFSLALGFGGGLALVLFLCRLLLPPDLAAGAGACAILFAATSAVATVVLGRMEADGEEPWERSTDELHAALRRLLFAEYPDLAHAGLFTVWAAEGLWIGITADRPLPVAVIYLLFYLITACLSMSGTSRLNQNALRRLAVCLAGTILGIGIRGVAG